MTSKIEVKVPDIGDFKQIPIIEIAVKPGQSVAKDDILLTLESDKASLDIPAPEAGVIGEVKVKIGDTLSIMASGVLMATAVRGLIERMKAAGTQKWLFWLEDGGWKDDAGSNATEAAFLGGSA